MGELKMNNLGDKSNFFKNPIGVIGIVGIG